MTGADALTGMARVFDATGRAAMAVGRLPPGPGAAAVAGLVEILARYEQRAQQEFSALLKQPLPAADPDHAGKWTRFAASNRQLMQAAAGIAAPAWIQPAFDEALTVASEWQAFAEAPAEKRQAFIGQVSAPAAQPATAEFAGPGTVAAVVVAGAGIPGRVKLGIAAGALSALVNVGSAYMASREEKKRSREFDDDDTPKAKRAKKEPAAIEDAAQRALDREIPGAMFSMEQLPGGRWVASVRRGMDVVSRRTAKSAEEAAGEAVQGAIDKGLKAEGPVVDAEYVVLPPAESKSAEAGGAG